MHNYELRIMTKINEIAGEPVYFDVDKIMNSSEQIYTQIISLLLSYACQSQNIAPIMLGRKLFPQFPCDWISARIKEVCLSALDINDDWDYRRLLELAGNISDELLQWVIGLAPMSSNAEVTEAADDFREMMCSYNRLIDLIHTYYPVNCKWESEAYQQSQQRQNLKKIVMNESLHVELHNLLFPCIKSAFPENHINVWTSMHDDEDYEDYPSLHFSVLMHKNRPILDDDTELLEALNGKRLDFEIYISILDKYYYTFILETTKQQSDGELKFSVIYDDKTLKEEISNFEQNLTALCYHRLTHTLAHKDVPNINLECLDEDEVKIFHCLFTDLITKF